jgi:hypothetical protein
LVDFCEAAHLYIWNTGFPVFTHKESHRATWVRPDRNKSTIKYGEEVSTDSRSFRGTCYTVYTVDYSLIY